MTTVITGTIKPLGDRIVLRPLQWKPSTILEVIRHGRPVRGEIVAIGPGCNRKKYKDGLKGKRSIMEYSKHFTPTELKPGDIVEIGGLNIFDGKGYAFPEFVVGNETMIMIQEADVAGVVCE